MRFSTPIPTLTHPVLAAHPVLPMVLGLLVLTLASAATTAAQEGLIVGLGIGPEYGPAGIRESCTPASDWVRGGSAELRAGWAVASRASVEARVGVQSGTDFTCDNVSGPGFDYDFGQFHTPIVRRNVTTPRGVHARFEGRARLAAASGESFITLGAGLLTNGVPYGVGSMGMRMSSDPATTRNALGVELDVVVYRVEWRERTGSFSVSADDPPTVYVEYGTARAVRGWMPELRLRFFYELGLFR